MDTLPGAAEVNVPERAANVLLWTASDLHKLCVVSALQAEMPAAVLSHAPPRRSRYCHEASTPAKLRAGRVPHR